jgi:predicted dehydrogenase
MTKIAFLGAAHIHTPGFIHAVKKRSDFSCKYVWDHDAARAEKRAAELEATPTQDLEAVLGDSEIAAVIVCSETDRHAQLVLPAAAIS